MILDNVFIEEKISSKIFPYITLTLGQLFPPDFEARPSNRAAHRHAFAFSVASRGSQTFASYAACLSAAKLVAFPFSEDSKESPSKITEIILKVSLRTRPLFVGTLG